MSKWEETKAYRDFLNRSKYSSLTQAKEVLKKTIPFRFSEKHEAYIRRCYKNTFNILEGAVRSGKTVDNIYAFASQLRTSPDRIHLASGSTMGNAKVNIGDANGFGLEWIFRGQCHFGKYHDMDALIVEGKSTGYKPKIVIFAGGSTANSFKKIRGISIGMWIATEINLHHDSFIKEAFNRQLAAKKRRVFWDMNPCHPKDPIYVNYIDLYAEKAEKNELLGGWNYEHCTIFDNINIPQYRIDEIVSQYDKGSIWYTRDILGQRSIAEGLCYVKLASAIAAKTGKYVVPPSDIQEMIKQGKIRQINVGVDFGGNGSGHAFVATATTTDYDKLFCLRSERWMGDDIDPDKLASLFIMFIKRIIVFYGFVTNVYCDSAEQVLIRGLKNALVKKNMANIKIKDALKSKITDRIFALEVLSARDKFYWTEECETLEDAISMAVWNPKNIDLERLDDGTSDIDTLDALEYSYERDIKRYIKERRAS